jgi:hypothetical protein
MVLVGSLTVLLLALVAYIVHGVFRWNEPIGKAKAIGGAVAFLCVVGLLVARILVARG